MAVNLSPVGGVAAQFFTSTGAVLTGGKIYTYAAGTTTPAVAYTSSNGATAWTNPIVLDAAGRVPSSGEIWLTDGVIYKFVLKDSNDVLIATYDNITGINSNSVAYTNQQEIVTATAGQTVFDLSISYQPGTNSLSVFVDGVNQYGPGASYAYTETDSNTVTFNSGLHVGAEVKFTTTQQQGAGAVDASQVTFYGFNGEVGNVQNLADDDGSDWIGFLQEGTGAVAISAQDKMRQIVSVKDFGAVGDGVTDDTAAIQAAIDYVYGTGDYGEVIIPPSTGEYIFTSVLVKSLVTLKSTGGVLKLKDNTCVDSGVSYYLVHNLGYDRVTYDGLVILGNRSGGNDQYLVADAITAVGFRTRVQNCVIYNPPDSGIMFSNVIRGACVNNYIEAANDVGIYVNGTGTYQGSEVSGNRIKSCLVTGIALKRETVGVLVDNNSIVDCPNAISHEDFGTVLGGHPSDITITNNQTYNTTNAAIVLNRLTNSIVANNKMSGVNQYGISMAGAVNSVVSGNTVVGGGSETTSHAAIFASSRVDPGDASVTVPDNLTVTGNVVAGYLGKGIYFQNGTNIAITGNNIKVGNEGLRLNSGVLGVLIQQNVIDGTPDVSLYSGATYITKNNVLSGALDDGHITISAGQPLPNSGSSTLTAQYIGQEALHLAANTWWKAYGTGLTQWTQIG